MSFFTTYEYENILSGIRSSSFYNNRDREREREREKEAKAKAAKKKEREIL
jgi:hypothetical protein